MIDNVAVSNFTKNRINLSLMTKVTVKFLASRKLSKKEVSVAFIGDAKMRRLNRERRGKDKITDVLSFRDSDSLPAGGNFLGEVVIDYQQIKRQAKIFKTSVQQELVFILVHGLLHLAGYDDKTEQEAKHMEMLGKKFIATL